MNTKPYKRNSITATQYEFDSIGKGIIKKGVEISPLLIPVKKKAPATFLKKAPSKSSSFKKKIDSANNLLSETIPIQAKAN
ncbi:hypothetical protein SAMN05428949_4140 [Chitinophaga sp. YR627]|uniref:hypothetical protein n=1 Tax=Chitinophaga sp. YR627 TaxID=1881041 RepID=UPI0008ECE401|nr:hypothetical protein [Chitinophaga sp. YR627]SFO01643.1 hypothetical protein SAMN05428949_4140 [Chitinophaga sp. YR627]